MTDAEVSLYAAIRCRVNPAVPINLREISVLPRLFDDKYIIGHRGIYLMTLTGMDICQ